MSVATRTRLGPAARREQLLGVGLELVAAGEVRTLDELTMEAVGARAGVSKALLFHYFPTKRKFQVAVAQAAADELLVRTEVPDPDDAGDVMAGVRASIDAFVEYVASRREAYVGLVRGSVNGDPGLRDVAEDTRERITRRTLERMAEVGMPTDVTAALAVRAWQAFVEEAVLSWLADPQLSRTDLLDFLGRSFVAVVGSTQSDA